MQRIALIASLLALLMAVPAMAQTGKDWGSGGFEGYGTKESGEAAQMAMDRGFEEVDQDADGMVTESELQESYGDQITQERSFSEMDQNADGGLSQEEYQMATGGEAGSEGGESQ
ncbi:hypothetical protein PCS_02120 [Desulfocurvibacter africanus PCS]|uniref:EF-hand domain-containing protein n=1 Tax=Desulfocurvibacter africanus PCS TaxID=1262666 RepID=M5PSC7_DESAF|nr:hypothetical protein [Desulfocurvibacter africanus]EMG37282.1 hypothetical protein PCS_02120 [Desulfocurvibacter africanus PCS]